VQAFGDNKITAKEYKGVYTTNFTTNWNIPSREIYPLWELGNMEEGSLLW
jgi:hypothetical protein